MTAAVAIITLVVIASGKTAMHSDVCSDRCLCVFARTEKLRETVQPETHNLSSFNNAHVIANPHNLIFLSALKCTFLTPKYTFLIKSTLK